MYRTLSTFRNVDNVPLIGCVIQYFTYKLKYKLDVKQTIFNSAKCSEVMSSKHAALLPVFMDKIRENDKSITGPYNMIL